MADLFGAGDRLRLARGLLPIGEGRTHMGRLCVLPSLRRQRRLKRKKLCCDFFAVHMIFAINVVRRQKL